MWPSRAITNPANRVVRSPHLLWRAVPDRTCWSTSQYVTDPSTSRDTVTARDKRAARLGRITGQRLRPPFEQVADRHEPLDRAEFVHHDRDMAMR